ncbi:MAG: nucleotidyltransferase family protein [Anaerolineaceae bacterium]|nr:nucleotidyltransferase family protein [Anaerolineaceae bacterium]
MNLADVIRILQEHQEDLKKMDVKSLAVFGSVARGDTHQDSDVDLLVEFSRPIGLFQFVDVKFYLEELLGTSVDLGTPRSLKPMIRDRILKEAVHVT